MTGQQVLSEPPPQLSALSLLQLSLLLSPRKSVFEASSEATEPSTRRRRKRRHWIRTAAAIPP